MIVKEVSDVCHGLFWCAGCVTRKQGEFWRITCTYAGWRGHSGEEATLCRACLSKMGNKLLAKLCPGEEATGRQAKRPSLTPDQRNVLKALSEGRCLVVKPNDYNDQFRGKVNLATARFLVRIGYAIGAGLHRDPVETGDAIEITRQGIDYLERKK